MVSISDSRVYTSVAVGTLDKHGLGPELYPQQQGKKANLFSYVLMVFIGKIFISCHHHWRIENAVFWMAFLFFF